MISIVSLLTFGHYFMGSRENTIDNSCDFDIIRIKKDNIMCVDYGKYSHYCNHFSLPQEFIIYNEKGVNGQNIVIKPEGMWEDTEFTKRKIADFYYRFTCDNRDKFPKLIQYIVPTPLYDVNPWPVLIMFIIFICCLFLCYSVLDMENTLNNNSNHFWTGYLVGNTGRRTNRIYCD